MKKVVALHERMEMQEILMMKNLSLTKTAVMQGLVRCDQLSNILAMEVKTGKQHVEQLTDLLKERKVIL